tara:strand:- start:11268 stop:12485 length:1218 start_codon:yes stop_codon:yes gene_type:complete
MLNQNNIKPKLVIVGAGIVGVTIAREASITNLFSDITLIEKEKRAGFHASTRNSGVIHSGFYYSADSNKARFCSNGNKLLRDYCIEKNLEFSPSGKVVVSKNDHEDEILKTLCDRAIKNNCSVKIINANLLNDYEPEALTNKSFLWSPNTWSASPKQLMRKLLFELEEKNISIRLNCKMVGVDKNSIILENGEKIKFDLIINASGGYALSIANMFGIETNYQILPFKGLYLKSKSKNKLFRKHIYPVPDMSQPFLGIHTTITSDNYIKLGPTALPVLSPENYSLFEGLDINISPEILLLQSKLFLENSFDFRNIAIREFKYLFKKNILKSAQELIRTKLKSDDFEWYSPGIRAQLFDKKKKKLENDILIKTVNNQIHLLNSISPAWTCSFQTSKYILEYIKKNFF